MGGTNVAEMHRTYKGVTYRSLTSMARELGVPHNDVYFLYKIGENIEEYLDIMTGVVHNKVIDLEKEGIMLDGVVYDTFKTLCSARSMAHSESILMVNRGYTIQEILAIYAERRRENSRVRNLSAITYNGKPYRNISDLARKLGLDYKALHKKIINGKTVEEAVHSEQKFQQRKEKKKQLMALVGKL